MKSSSENKAPASEERTLNEVYEAAESAKMIFTPETPAIHQVYVRHVHALKKVAAHARATDLVKKEMYNALKIASRFFLLQSPDCKGNEEVARALQAYEKEQNGLETR